MKLSFPSATRQRRRFEIPKPNKTAPCFLVYYDGGSASVAALSEACAQAGHETTVIAAYLDMVPHTEPLDCKTSVRTFEANAILAAATVNAHMRGIKIQTEVVHCRVKGPALVNLAAQHANAVIFLGVEPCAEQGNQDAFVDYVEALAPADLFIIEI